MQPPNQPFPPQPNSQMQEVLSLVGILLMVAGGISLAYALFGVATTLASPDSKWVLRFVQDAELREKLREILDMQNKGSSLLLRLIWPMMTVAVNAFVVFGGFQARQGRMYPVAVAVSVICIVPLCFNGCCCVLSMPAGIFALVQLMKPEVKALFTS